MLALSPYTGHNYLYGDNDHLPSVPIGLQPHCIVCRQPDCALRSHKAWAKKFHSKRRGYRHAPVRQVGNGKVNPFARYPITVTKDLEQLYALGWGRWNTDFHGPERHLFPTSRFTSAFRAAWNDEALHYGLLSAIATKISHMRNGETDQLALSLQGRAIVAQSKALAVSKGEMSDARVMTALCIMSNAWAMNKGDDLAVHLRMITVWIQHKGGLDQLGMDGIIADNLMYGDFVNAAVFNQLPRFSVRLPAILSSTAPQTGPVYTNMQTLGLISAEVASMATHYLVLLKIFDRAAKGIYKSSEATYFAYLANVVEYQLAITNLEHHDTNTIDECIVLAIFISNHTLLRAYGDIVASVSMFEVRFWRCLDELRRKDVFAVHGLYELECYLVCVGFLSTVRRPSLFLKKGTSILTDLRRKGFGYVRDFDHLCRVLDTYGWSQSACMKLYVTIWRESTALLKVKLED